MITPFDYILADKQKVNKLQSDLIKLGIKEEHIHILPNNVIELDKRKNIKKIKQLCKINNIEHLFVNGKELI